MSARVYRPPRVVTTFSLAGYPRDEAEFIIDSYSPPEDVRAWFVLVRELCRRIWTAEDK
jgi:hypothetical protein